MRFGPLPLADAAGAILAHSLKLAGLSFRKGRVLSGEDIAALAAAGLDTVVAALPEPGDVAEDAAAARLAHAVAGPGLTVSAAFTGRVNLFAAVAGLAVVDRDRVDRLNLLHESLTLATLPAYTPVEAGQMVATVKIIPFAAPGDAVTAAEALTAPGPLLHVAPWQGLRAGLVQTLLPGLKPTVLEKTVAATRDRLAGVGATLAAERRVPHEGAAVATALTDLHDAGCTLLLVAGASAITDRRDVVPAGVVEAGGEVLHFGMPVDPGNLLLLGRLHGVPVLGLPSCARSPRLNGFDWVLHRLAAGLEVTGPDIMRMGVGGLLSEIPTRPLPRAQATVPPRAPRIAALVLAAGLSRRMGRNKLLADVGGTPLVTRAVDAALASLVRSVTVVVGHQQDAVRDALTGRAVRIVEAAEHAAGLSASLKAGLRALPDDADGVLVLLGDMPRVEAAAIDRLIAAYAPAEGRAVCVPTFRSRRGNPVLWDRRFVAEMLELTGDTGAKALLDRHADLVCEVEMPDDGVLVDVDTPDALAALMGGP